VLILLIALNAAGYEQPGIYVSIQVWGEVRNPGHYAVPPNINIVEAISFAGGPLRSANLNRVKVVSINGDVVIVNVNDFINGKKKSIPMISPGDVVIVPRSASATLGDVVRFLSIIAGAVAILYQTFWSR